MKQRQPNVLILMSDEQRVDTLGAYGNPVARTPHIDALAANGTRFNHCYTPYSLCCPARASLWTGMMPHNHHVLANWLHIRPELRDGGMVAAFARSGYYTAYTGKWHVPGTTPSRMGFASSLAIPDVIDGRDRGRHISEYRAYATGLGYEIDPNDIENLTFAEQQMTLPRSKVICGTSEIHLDHHLETWQTERFLEQLTQRPAGAPFFAVCSYNAPHFPMIVPEPFASLINPNEVELPPNFSSGLDGKPDEIIGSKHYQQTRDLDEPSWRKLISHYWGFCSLIDAQVGRIVAWLQAEGLYDDTIIVYLSDHGDMMGSHRLNLKGFEVQYEEVNRVPLIVSHPESRRGSTRDMFVSLLDVIPTLAESCGVDIGSATDGVSFAGALSGSEPDRHRDYVISEAFHAASKARGEYENPNDYTPETWRPMNVCIRTPEDKYVFHGKDIDEYYDLVADPLETQNLYPDHAPAERISELRAAILDELQSSVPRLAEIVAGKMR